MHKTVRLAIDVGKARIGVARSDIDGTMALPVETVIRNDMASRRIIELANEYAAGVIYVGLPLSLKGTDTASTLDARDFASGLAGKIDCEIRLVDERLSTVTAAQALRSVGHSAKSAKGIIDQAAAVVILEQALTIEKATQEWAGRRIDE